MTADLSDAIAKLGRSRDHFGILVELVAAFRRDAYRVEAQNDWPNSMQVVVFAEPLRDPPAREWGPIIGDIVHNLRSALDNMVYALASFREGPAPDPVEGKWARLAFPVRRTDAEWRSIRSDRLWALDDTEADAIRGLQPFSTGQESPEREPLMILEALWNIDKHRHLHLVGATFELADVISVRPFDSAPDIPLKVISQRAAGPLKDRTEIARLEQVGPPWTNMPEAHADLRFTPDVAFGEGHPAYGGSLLETLGDCGRRVEEILVTFGA